MTGNQMKKVCISGTLILVGLFAFSNFAYAQGKAIKETSKTGRNIVKTATKGIKEIEVLKNTQLTNAAFEKTFGKIFN